MIRHVKVRSLDMSMILFKFNRINRVLISPIFCIFFAESFYAGSDINILGNQFAITW
jgi:hypothetical protein